MRVTFPQQVCFLSQIRPAFEDALHDANWNYWFFVAFIAPFCIFTFAYVLRRNVIYFAPVAIAHFYWHIVLEFVNSVGFLKQQRKPKMNGS